MELNSEEILHNIVRINGYSNMGAVIKSGTGIMYRIPYQDNLAYETVITNKHVLEGCDYYKVFFKATNNQGKYSSGSEKYVDFFPQDCSYHPDEDIDLVTINISPYLNELYSQGVSLLLTSVTQEQMPILVLLLTLTDNLGL